MPRIVAWDSWAFLEVALDLARRKEVEALAQKVDAVFTSRDVLGETYTAIHRRAGRKAAVGWWDAVEATELRIVEPPLAAIRALLSERRSERLSFPDGSLAAAAFDASVDEIATEDSGFAALGLIPLFGRR